MPQEISENPIPILLKDVLKYSQSGELAVETGKIRKSLFFSNGVMIYARSSAFDEQLGVLLHLLGKITEEQYDYISGLAHSPDEDVGNILIQDHIVGEEDLRSVVLYQIKKIAISVFLTERGTWEFIEKLSPTLKDKKNSIPIPEIIMGGGRKLEHLSFFKKKFYSYAPKGKKIPEAYERLLSVEEKLLFKGLEGCEDLTNFEIISKLNVDPLFYWRTMVIFWLLEMVAFSPKEVQYNIGQEIQELLLLNNRIESKEIDAFGILGIENITDSEEAEIKYLSLLHRYHPDRFGSAAAPEIKKTAESVTKIIEKAYRSIQQDVKIENKTWEKEKERENVKVTEKVTEKEMEVETEKETEKEISDIKEITGTGEIHDPQDEAKVFYLKARDLYHSKRYRDAVDVLKQTIQIDPTIAEYHFLLAKCQTELEFFDGDAEKNYKKAIEIDSWNADYIYNLALLFKRQEKNKLAMKCFQRVLEVNPRYVKAEIAINELQGKKIKKPPFSF